MTRRAPFDLFVASCDGSGGIYRFRIDGEQVAELAKLPLPSPMYMTLEGSRMHIILRAGAADGCSRYLSAELSDSGDFIGTTNPVSTFGEVACHLLATDGKVYVTNYISGSISLLPDGKLVTHEGRGVDPERQSSPHTHFVGKLSSGDIAVTDLGLDRIFIYDGELRAVSSVKLPDGCGPRHLAENVSRGLVFSANELDSTVSTLRLYGRELRYLDSVCTLDGKTRVGESTVAAIRAVGDEVFVSNRGEDSVAVFRLSGCKLEKLRTVYTLGKSPRDFTVFDGLIIAANETSDSVTVLDAESGELIARIAVPSPLCVIARRNE